ncbi:MAG: hypothetical protein M1153_01325 [Patescibacteria group bacterium]|nr:hypothetical protein [Patescibacteria group bacterium]
MVLDAILEATEKTGKAIRRKLHQTGVSEVDNLSTDLLDKLREVNSISIKARIIRNNYADLYETASRFQRIMSGM